LSNLLSRLQQLLLKRWFLVGLACMLALGISLAETIKPLRDAATFRNAVVFVVLFCMALPLEASAMWQALRRPWAPLLGVAMNFGLLPLFAWLVSRGLDPTMAAGLLVAAASPCTMASAVVWTRKGNGNDAVAILISMTTSATCFLATPFWLNLMIGDSRPIDPWKMIAKLGLLVVLPMILAQTLRYSSKIAKWSTANKTRISIVAQSGLLIMVLIGAIEIGLRLRENSEHFTLVQVLSMAAAVQVVHLTMLATGYFLAWLLRMPRGDRVAVGIAGSQKTLLVGLQIGVDLGITILPMVVYHVSQLLVDTFIVDYWKKKSEEK